MTYRLFGSDNEVLATYGSLESCKQHARSDNRHDVRWEGPADHGPQGNAKHWYGFSEKRIHGQVEREYLIVEWAIADGPKTEEKSSGKVDRHGDGGDGGLPSDGGRQGMVEQIQHPIATRASVNGEILKPGAVLRATDVYSSTTGKWELCPCPGAVLPEGLEVVWVRPNS